MLIFIIICSLSVNALRYLLTPDYQVVQDTDQYIIEAYYNNTVNSTGWNFLKITSSPQQYSDVEQFHAAGYIEGYLTYHEIYDAYRNFIEYILDGKHYLPLSASIFIDKQYQWMKLQSKLDTPVWRQVRNLLAQLEGMYEGYTKQTSQTHMELSFTQFYYLTNMGDLEDLIPSAAEILKHGIGNCNTYIKDGHITHNTFNVYSLMLRVYKSYNFRLSDSSVLTNLSFSSRPGDLESKDDFVVLKDTQMVVTETSLNNWNYSNYQYLHYDSLPTWVRVNVASRLASSPTHWAELFEVHRSGTHNNQWIISDFTTLIMVEEAFYHYKVHDITNTLYKSQGFVASYNVPYDQQIFHDNSYDKTEQKTYQEDPRAVQFALYSKDVHNLNDAARLIRRNNVTQEYDVCKNAISPRCDISSSFTFGGIDGKAINKELLQRQAVWLISSPTYQDHPPFDWSKFPQVPHHGMTDNWYFPWYEYSDDTFTITQLFYDQ